ncbi:MAG: NAD-dependent epimerase/dehydratase family protein [Planctomycetota bacterium]|nr:MAG: NAD-dependent epimerase/dehydratase family protein [Planctomycetota bacterium]
MYESFAHSAALEEHLSRPTPGVMSTLSRLDGDVIVLGAGGKMGPTLARMVRRGLDAVGGADRRVTAVSRFSERRIGEQLERHGVKTISCDLMDEAAVQRLPEAALVIHMTGQKFGTSDAPERTWAVNTLAPAIAARAYARSRMVLFSTGCVYPLVPVAGLGACESTPLTPFGEYPNACVARERVVAYEALASGMRLLQFRLCYAVEPRYGVIHDVARKVAAGERVDLGMGFVQLIWQRDASARAIQGLEAAASPPVALNVTGVDRVSIRSLAERCGERLGRPPQFVGTEADEAWLWDARACAARFGPPETSTAEAVDMVCDWIGRGKESLGKPTHFEVRDGAF